jgi:uncharacterized delta-60 repeat protein
MRGPRLVRGVAVLVAALLVGAAFSAAAQAAPGDLDLTFASGGKQRTDFGFGSSEAAATVLQPDGKIVAVGGVRGSGVPGDCGPSDFALARYNTDGSLDTSFGGDGRQTTDFGGTDGAKGVALQDDGKIVVVGGGGGGCFGDFALARYNMDGSLDASFSGDGKLLATDLGQANGVAVQDDGKIVVVGIGFLARYNSDGSLDTSFSGDGKLTTDFGAYGVALQGDGKIVAAGSGAGDFAVARYNPSDGSLDTGFSGDGKQTADFGGSDQANGVALQGDGNIVAVGVGFGTDRTNDFALARYLGA